MAELSPVDRMVANSIPDSINFLTNSFGQANNALVSLFTKHYNWYQLHSKRAGVS